MLSKKQVSDICMLHQNGQCRYLAYDSETNGQVCLKQSVYKKKVDEKLGQIVAEKTAKNQPYDNLPIDNNCEGYPLLKHTPQGYDVP